MIKVEDLHFQYKDGTKALDGIDLEIAAGSRVAVLGPNGAGKSTLLLHFNAINLPQRGKVMVGGYDANGKNAPLIRSLVGMVFQDPDDQVFCHTVREDVAFGPVNMGLSPGEVERRVEEALYTVGLTALADKAPYHLSYGQKKRVAIAGVLAMQPRVIVLDEPMAFLDPASRDGLVQILHRLHQNGTTIIIATHDVDLAAEWAEQVVVLQSGRVAARGGAELLVDRQLVERCQLRLPVVSKMFSLATAWQGKPLPLRLVDGVMVLEDLLRRASQENSVAPDHGYMGEEPGMDKLVWLEPLHLHYHTGEEVVLRAVCGAPMRRSIWPQQAKLVARVIGESQEDVWALTAPVAPDVHNLVFEAGGEGYYRAIMQVNHFSEKAETVFTAIMDVPVGHDLAPQQLDGAAVGVDLLLQPNPVASYRYGDKVKFQVFWQGKPLAGAIVKGTYHLREEPGYVWQATTDDAGVVWLELGARGHWLLVVEHDRNCTTYLLPGVR
ncbi:ATP-binding cassette domain-containing protein [Desulfurispora thermophila]|uniref:ATP-binding cassette domain-containing protein n=1 Tax=Desulfurispora thermophila TaxID=265470 RepID=UPI00037FF87E|nr:ATP-binding cassette domain-containing protein [Desulfurispora thermophila]